MDKKDALKSMLNNIINDKPEEATLDLHNYLTAKMREVSGLASAEAEPEAVVADEKPAEAAENNADAGDE